MFEHGGQGAGAGGDAGPTLTAAALDRLVQTIPAPGDLCLVPSLRLSLGAHHRGRDRRIVTYAETAPVDPELIECLAGLDPTSLDEDGALGLTVAWQRVTNYAEAHRTRAVAATVAASPDTREIPRELHASAQVGPALGLGSGAADTIITASPELLSRLPATFAAMLAGELSWRKASSLALATIGLTDDQAAAVEAKVLPKAADRSPAAHDAAVRRAVDQIDPDHTDRERNQRDRDTRLVTHHYGAGMGQVFIDAPSEWVDAIRAAANAYARRCKAAGDPRTLDVLRVHFLYQAAMSFLSHGDAIHCHQHCNPTPGSGPAYPDDRDGRPDAQPATPAQPAPAPSGQHGRPVALTVVWDLTSLLGLTNHCALLTDSDTLIPPSAVRQLLAGGGRIRRMLIDPDTGHQFDLTRRTWLLPATDGRAHRQPVVLTVTTTARWDDLDDDARAAVDKLDPTLAKVLRELLEHPLTADDLDNRPDAETPSPALADYVATRAAHPVNPMAGPTNASAADLDHHTARRDGGHTTRTNLGPLVRRWHRLKTFDDWTVHQTKHHWEWTSPTGRRYKTEPHDYRLGP
jgi:hypothetical protein